MNNSAIINTQSLISKKILTILDNTMALTTVTVSNKGQIAIPVSIREEMGIDEGDTLVMFQIDDKILIEKEKDVEKTMKDDLRDILKLSEESLKEVWDNREDEIWNKYKKRK